ncbi:hypothetical protein Dimus_034981 [Dionaea muscipula]
MRDLLIQVGCHMALLDKGKKSEAMKDEDWEDMDLKAMSIIRLCLSNNVLLNITDEETSEKLWANTVDKLSYDSVSSALLHDELQRKVNLGSSSEREESEVHMTRDRSFDLGGKKSFKSKSSAGALNPKDMMTSENVGVVVSRDT